MDPIMKTEGRTRHVLGVSGGKDSAALAIYMRDRVPEMEYFFTDTGSELPEIYEYLDRLEAVLGKPITRINAERGFEHWLWVYQGVLPSPQMRWCTKNLKIKPFEQWLGDDEIYTYIGIRADEDRSGYISTRPNVHPVFPFKEDDLEKADILQILDDAGVGMPSYYEWRTRSGCYFCFFQRKIEWVELSERHPDLFEKAVEFEEKLGYEGTAMEERQYTWTQGETLGELVARKDEIKAKHQVAIQKETARSSGRRLLEIVEIVHDEDDDSTGCDTCHL